MKIDASKVVHKLRILRIGSCTCMTKTPEAQYHESECRYRTLVEAEALIIAAFEPKQEPA